jgi:hypothetical protein
MNLNQLTAVISTIASIVIIFSVTIGNGSAQAKVYSVCSIICFTTVALGAMMNNSLSGTGNYTLITVLLNLSLIAAVILPQLMYAFTVSKHSKKIVSSDQLEYNGSVTALSTMTMILFLFVIFISNKKTSLEVNGFLIKSIVACSFISAITCGLVRMMSTNLSRMTDNAITQSLT